MLLHIVIVGEIGLHTYMWKTVHASSIYLPFNVCNVGTVVIDCVHYFVHCRDPLEYLYDNKSILIIAR